MTTNRRDVPADGLVVHLSREVSGEHAERGFGGRERVGDAPPKAEARVSVEAGGVGGKRRLGQSGAEEGLRRLQQLRIKSSRGGVGERAADSSSLKKASSCMRESASATMFAEPAT